MVASSRKAQTKTAGKNSARQVFCGELVKVSNRFRNGNRALKTKTVQKDVFKTHKKIWDSQSAAQKHKFFKKARQGIARAVYKLVDDHETVLTNLQITNQRIADDEAKEGALFVRSCKWSERNENKLEDMFKNGPFDNQYVAKRRSDVKYGPPPPVDSVQEAIEKMPVDPKQVYSRPAWVGAVAKHREHFTDSVFILKKADQPDSFFKFMMAPQQPIHISLSPLTLLDEYVEIQGSGGRVDASMAPDRWRWKFQVQWMTFTPWFQLPTGLAGDISVIKDVLHIGNGLCASDSNAESLESVLARLPAVAAAEEKSTSTNTKRHPTHEAIIRVHPFMRGSIERDERDAKKTGRQTQNQTGQFLRRRRRRRRHRRIDRGRGFNSL